nr:hypothetical protein [Tanacetum cinerariifolium]
MFDELLNSPPSVDPQAPEVIAPIVEVIPLVQAESTGSPSLTTVDEDAPSPNEYGIDGFGLGFGALTGALTGSTTGATTGSEFVHLFIDISYHCVWITSSKDNKPAPAKHPKPLKNTTSKPAPSKKIRKGKDYTNDADNASDMELSTSKADTEILNVDEQHGEEVSHTVALKERTVELDKGHARSDPSKTPES